MVSGETRRRCKHLSISDVINVHTEVLGIRDQRVQRSREAYRLQLLSQTRHEEPLEDHRQHRPIVSRTFEVDIRHDGSQLKKAVLMSAP